MKVNWKNICDSRCAVDSLYEWIEGTISDSKLVNILRKLKLESYNIIKHFCKYKSKFLRNNEVIIIKRWHEDYNHSFNEWNKNQFWKPSSEIGRFRKQHALDCGKSQCGICHSDKYPKREITRKEYLSDRSFKEQIKEI